jgi:hypothetical protein
MKKHSFVGSGFPALVNLSRRSFIGGGLGALGLTAWQHRAIAQTGGVAPSRFVFLYTPCGRDPSWQTDTPGASFTLCPTLQMFEPYRSRMCLLDGFTLVNFGYAAFNSHFGGNSTLLGGKAPIKVGVAANEGVPASSQRTFDHLLADRIGATSPVRNIVLGGFDKNNVSGVQQLSYTGSNEPTLPIHLPDRAFAALFAGANAPPMPAGDAIARQTWEKEILGLVQLQNASFKSQLGQRELQQLQAYESNLNDTFKRVSSTVTPMPPSQSCSGVTLQQLQAGLSTEPFQQTHDLQSRTLAAALACGRTRVAVYSMAGIESSMVAPGTTGKHHLHNTDVAHYQAFDRYYGARIKFLLDEIDKYPEGNGTVLDSTIIVWSSDISWTPPDHEQRRHPIFLFGGLPGKKLKMGQYLKMPFDMGSNREQSIANVNNRRMHEVLLTIAQAMGFTDLQDFADPKYNQGPVVELLA